jgi:serine/threonine protein kinase
MLMNDAETTKTVANSDLSVRRTSPEQMIGMIVGRKYQLLEIIGKGGMSAVFSARHLFTKKLFAIKVVDLQSENAKRDLLRIKREFEILRDLGHQNIVSAFDFGVDRAEFAYLVMEYIAGGSLSRRIKTAGPLSLDCFLHVMLQIAEGLSHSHQHGFIHKDLKPDNIMLEPIQGKSGVRIVDFGIAGTPALDDNDNQELAQAGMILGSPYYMSPEQCRSLPLDNRSDIYSFGCLMYEALSGKPPHSGSSVYETIRKHITAAPLPLVAPQLNNAEAAHLEAIILKALKKSPEDRYQNISELIRELAAMANRIGRLCALSPAA